MKIYTTIGRQKSIKKFLEMFFSNKQHMHNLGLDTYFDPECKNLQCNKLRIRSYDDIFDLVNTYYKCSNEELMKILLSLELTDINDTKLFFYPSCCETIRRITIYFYHISDRYLLAAHQYNSKHSWRELFSLVIDINEFEKSKLNIRDFYQQSLTKK